MTGLPPADWYPDPEVSGQQRYWDGREWTEHRAPGLHPGPPSYVSDVPEQQPGQNPAGDVAPWLWQSIVVTVVGFACCSVAFFVPLLGSMAGGVGIVYATQANTARSLGNRALAQQHARLARTWSLVGVGLIALGLLGTFGLFAVSIVTGG